MENKIFSDLIIIKNSENKINKKIHYNDQFYAIHCLDKNLSQISSVGNLTDVYINIFIDLDKIIGIGSYNYKYLSKISKLSIIQHGKNINNVFDYKLDENNLINNKIYSLTTPNHYKDSHSVISYHKLNFNSIEKTNNTKLYIRYTSCNNFCQFMLNSFLIYKVT
jgi:hypothetical protein